MWSQVGDAVIFNQNHRNSLNNYDLIMTTNATAPGVCFHGKFNAYVGLTVKSRATDNKFASVYNSTDDGTQVCVTTADAADNSFTTFYGAHFTLFVRMKVPPGTKANDVVVKNEDFHELDSGVVG